VTFDFQLAGKVRRS